MGKFMMNGIPYGGGDIEANPSGTATDTLTKLGIEGTVYEIQGGGGGGSSAKAYTEVVLWSGTATTSAWATPATLNLNDSVHNYDMLMVQFSNNSTSRAYVQILVSEIPSDYSGLYFCNQAYGSYSDNSDSRCPFVQVSASNEITGYTSTGTNLTYTKVIGIKFGGNLSPIIYSTEEREVGVWTDGKPLYQRTYEYSGEYTSNNVLQMQGLSNMEHVIIVNSQCEDTGGHILFLPYANATANYVRSYYLTLQDNTFNLLCNSNSPIKNPTITIQYTKTTDTAGSGQYTTLGTPTVHYDGNEKIVGTWFGVTLYEKSYNINIPQISNSDEEVTIDASFGSNKVLRDYKIIFNGLSNNRTNYQSSISDTVFINGNNQLIYYLSKNGTWWNNMNTTTIHVQYTKTSS